MGSSDGRGVPRHNTNKKPVFRLEQISELVVDLFFDHEFYVPVRVRALLEEFGVVTQLAPGIYRIDLMPSSDVDLTIAYLNDFTTVDATNAHLRPDKRREA